MNYSVFITCPIPQAGVDLLRPACETIDVGPEDRVPATNELAAAVRGRDAVVCNVRDTIDADVLAAAAPSCKVFANYGVGVNHIDLQAAERLRIVVTNTPGVLTDATADLTWTLLFAVARRVVEGADLVRSGQWTGWAPMQLRGADVSGRTLGIVGAGRIGTAVGLRSVGFGMSVLYVDRQPSAELDRIGARNVSLDECISAAHFLTLHVPLTPESRHLIGPRELGLMRRDAFLINTSRGPVMDEVALVRALQDGRISGAGLDVFENEPKIAPELLRLPNVVCLPHLGSATIDTRDKMAQMAATDLLRVLNGESPLHPVTAGA